MDTRARLITYVTAICARCERSLTYQEWSKGLVARDLRRVCGWSDTKHEGWVCKACLADETAHYLDALLGRLS